MRQALLRHVLIVIVAAAICRAPTMRRALIDAVKAGDLAAVQRLARVASRPSTPPKRTARRRSTGPCAPTMARRCNCCCAPARTPTRPTATASRRCRWRRSTATPRIVSALLEAGADPNTRLAEDQTILMTAARAGSPEVLKLLLDRGADVNAREARGGRDRADVGGAGEPRRRGHAARARGARHRRPLDGDVVPASPLRRRHRRAADRAAARRLDAADVRRAAERHRRRARAGRRRRRPRISPIPTARRRWSSPSSTATSIWRSCCSRRAPTRTSPTRRAWRRSTRRST